MNSPFSGTPADSRFARNDKRIRNLKKAFVIAAIPFLLPSEAHASLSSFVSGLFSADVRAAEVEERVINSQNMSLLQAAINTDPNPAKGGAEVTIVADTALLADSGPTGTIADVEEARDAGEISIYVVRDGDSVGKIAQLFGVSSNTIIWANNLTSKAIVNPGDTLVILPMTGVRHTVKSGDTIKTIAAKYKGDADEILKFNDLSINAKLAVGDIILIPDGEIAPSVTSKASKTVNTWKSEYSGPSYEGYYMRPITGGVRTQGLHGYNGVDLAAPVGTPIYASAAGTVIVAKMGGWNGGYGNYVVIRHGNGTQTLYAHASAISTSVGATVKKGQLIAAVGSTGQSTGPHVHFEIRGAKNPF
jgi:LysM repeat protein